MPKPEVLDARFDFRGGRNSAVSPDLLNKEELVDATNARLSAKYGAATKRSGSQRIHLTAFAGPIRGVFQWDSPGGRQTVVISGGKLHFRTGFDYGVAFSQAATASINRSTDPLTNNGWVVNNDFADETVPINAASQTSVTSENRLGDPTVDTNLPAVDQVYSFLTSGFKVTADGTGLSGTYAAVTADATIEYSCNSGGVWTALPGLYRVTAGIGQVNSTTFTPSVTIPCGAAPVWVRLRITVYCVGGGTGSGVGKVETLNTIVSWLTGAAQFSLDKPTFFAPFRASSAGAPLVLFMASGGHYFMWDGISTLTQLDPTNSAPLATLLASYNTRMFVVHKDFPKTVFWSRIGDATNFVPGQLNDGSSALVDYLTGQAIVAMEVLGSSLLLATDDSIVRLTGQSSADVIIAQNTEGISSEVGVISPQGLKRFENVAALLNNRGVYVANEQYVQPLSDKITPDIQAFGDAALETGIIDYNHGTGRNELWLVVGDTAFVQSVRLQAWYGPWTYPFSMTYLTHYHDATGRHTLLSGGEDGFVRDMDYTTSARDDVLYDGSGGSTYTMTLEIPTIHFGNPGVTHALQGMRLQADLPSGHAAVVKTSFDGGAETTDTLETTSGLQNQRRDLNGQGKRLRMRFVDSGSVISSIFGYVLKAWEYGERDD